jgi:hypothetical protein
MKKNISIKSSELNRVAVKFARKQSREEEIRSHGKPIAARGHVQESKKAYSRKRNKAIDFENPLPCFVLLSD